MIFYGNGIVLLNGKNKIKFDISNRETPDGFGVYETNDENECKRLIELGYKYIGNLPKKEINDTSKTEQKPKRKRRTKAEIEADNKE